MHKLSAVLGAVAIAMLGAACGSAGTSSTTASDAGAGTAKTGSMVAFARCMRANGVPNFPDPTGHGMLISASPRGMTVNGVAVNGPAFQHAMQVCRPQLPNHGTPPPLTASQRAAALRMAQCMRTHGVPNFPDPQFQGGGVRIRLRTGANPQSPAFQHAQAVCGPIIGKG